MITSKNKKKTKKEERASRLVENYLYNMGHEYDKMLNEQFDSEEVQKIEVPESLKEWFNEYNKELKKEIAKKERKKRWLRWTKRVAMIFVALFLSFSAFILTSEAHRVRFFNYFVEVKEQYTKLEISEKNVDYLDQIPDDWTDFAYPTYIPDGYYLENAESGEGIKFLTFINKKNDRIIFSQINLNSAHNYDNEKSNTKTIEIHNATGYLSIHNREKELYWGKNDTIFTIYSLEEIDIIVQIAESVVF